MRIHIGLFFLFIFSVSANAGGDPEFVKIPEGYKGSFTLYHTQNRDNNKQVVDLYANKKAVESVSSGTLADGSVVVMEIYKPEVDEAGKPIADANGVFKKSKLAAVAVMEKRDNWDAQFPAEHRADDWGFAIYDAKGGVKENNLDCASCHIPLNKQDYLFTFHALADYN